jgi:hypothetical protein
MAQPGKDDALNMLKAWFERDLSRYARWDRDVELVEHLADGTVRVRIYTDVHCYAISALGGYSYAPSEPRVEGRPSSYLGCIASARKPRAGEDWGRGNDLHDGPLTEETWIGILGDIVSYEMVQLQWQKMPAGVGRRGERLTHPQADESLPTYGSDKAAHGTITASEDGLIATVWPAGWKPAAPSLEDDGGLRARMIVAAPSEDHPAIGVATGPQLDRLAAMYGLHRFGCGQSAAA